MDVKASSGTPSAASKSGDGSNASHEAGATSPGTSPIGSPSEVRFAVVMYGGVSLAIYINGIAQELLRMVQATATGGDVKDPNRPLIDGGKLKSSDRAYRKLSYLLAGEEYEDLESRVENNAPISTRFIVDIISGTSAGGINGIFLAKALANGQDMKELQELWVKEGDIGRLINDKRSIAKPLSLIRPPASLLNSQRMYLKLLDAFEGMDKAASVTVTGGAPTDSPYVDELDLFVTTTDIQGVTLPIQLADAVVHERRHKNVFHFIYSKAKVSGEKVTWNDFEAKNNPFLAFASRCTSAFPFAFEPMALGDIDDVLRKLRRYGKDSESEGSQWQRFFRDYPGSDVAGTVPFHKRSFGDGGYLDNKPFTYATETLSRRRADVPVDRKLIYIEPSPEHPERDVETARKPNALENSMAALLKLPRYETIREDLERVIKGNRLIERINRILRNVERDKDLVGWQQRDRRRIDAMTEPGEESALWAREDLTDKQWATLDLSDMAKRKGVGYVGYHRLEIAAVTDDLAKLVAGVAGLNEESDYVLVTRSLTRAWRDGKYTEYHDGRPTMNAFLHSFDLSYPIRRLNFLRSRIDRFYDIDQEALEVIKGHGTGPGTSDPVEQAKHNKAFQDGFRDELLHVKRNLNNIYASLRRAGRLLRSHHTPGQAAASPQAAKPVSPLYQQIQDLIKGIGEALVQEQFQAGTLPRGKEPTEPGRLILDYFLDPSRNTAASEDVARKGPRDQERIESESDKRARKFLEENETVHEQFRIVGESIEKTLTPLLEDANQQCIKLLLNTGTGDGTSAGAGAWVARSVLYHYYKNYDDYDMIIFPILYNTNVGEGDAVEIIRISPEDADSLISERDTGCYKLAGTSLGHFGAFLASVWRKNDILWGRLDGAERMIKAVMPGDPRTAELVGEAQAAIVLETIEGMGPEERRDLMVESLMRPKGGEADGPGLSNFIKNLKGKATSEQKADLDKLIDEGEIRDYYLDVFKTRSRLEPQQAMETAARAATVVGDMLSDISAQYNVANKYISWVARLGKVSWSLIEVAVPRSIPNLVFFHWLKLLYLFEVVLIVGSTLLLNATIQRFSLTAFAITLATHLTVLILGDQMQYKNKWFGVVKGLGVALFVSLVVLGVLSFLAITGIAGSWWETLTKVNEWFKGLPPNGWISRWPVRIAIVSIFLVFLLLVIRKDRPLAKAKRT